MRNIVVFFAIVTVVVFSWFLSAAFRDEGIRDYCFDRRPPQYSLEVILDKCSYLISTEDKNIKKAILTRADLHFRNGYTLEAISDYDLFIQKFPDFKEIKRIEALAIEMNLELAKHSREVEFRVGRVINDPENRERVYELIASLRTAGDRNLYANSMRLLGEAPDLFVAVRLIGFFEILDFESDELAVSYLRGELNTQSEKQNNYKISLQEEMRWICREVVSNCVAY